jgi:hypothetical protein
MGDWVTAAIEASGDNALRRKLRKLRELADASMIDSPQFRIYADFYDALQNGTDETRRQLLAEAEREEVAAKQGAAA